MRTRTTRTMDDGATKFWTTDCIRHPKRRLCICCPNGIHSVDGGRVIDDVVDARKEGKATDVDVDIDIDTFYKTLTTMQRRQNEKNADSSNEPASVATSQQCHSIMDNRKQFRRKQDPTINTLLGYHNKSQTPAIDIDEIVYKSRDMPAKASADVQESLEQAIHDFEETLIRSTTSDVRSPLVSPLLTNKFSSSLSLKSDAKSDSSYYKTAAALINLDRIFSFDEHNTNGSVSPPEMFRSSPSDSMRTNSPQSSSSGYNYKNGYSKTHSPDPPSSSESTRNEFTKDASINGGTPSFTEYQRKEFLKVQTPLSEHLRNESMKSNNYSEISESLRTDNLFNNAQTPPESMFSSNLERTNQAERGEQEFDNTPQQSPDPLSLSAILPTSRVLFPKEILSTNDIGVNCSTSTRDVGTSSTPFFSKNVSVCTSYPNLIDSGTMTDCSANNSSSDKSSSKESCMPSSSLSLSQILDGSFVGKSSTSIGTQTYSRLSSLVIIEKRDQAIQTEVQTTAVSDAAIGSDCRLRNIFDKSPLNKKTISTTTDSLPGRWMANSELQTIIENRRLSQSKHSQTKDVSVRERVLCKKAASQTEAPPAPPKVKDASVNTSKKILVDAAVGDDRSINNDASSSLGEWCDKCRQSRLSNSTSNLSGSTSSLLLANQSVSKIPRPTSAQTSPNSKKKKMLMRQDTYVTIPSAELEKLKELQRKRSSSETSESNVQCELSNTDHNKVNAMKSTTRAKEVDGSFFVPISDNRTRTEPSKEMRAAMKIINESLKKQNFAKLKETSLKNVISLIQQEWFKVSSLSTSDPFIVEDYLETFQAVSTHLFEFIVNLKDGAGNTAIHYAVSHGNFDIVSILLDSKVCDISVVNDAGYSCIMLVSLAQLKSNSYNDVIKRLFSMADVNKKAKQHGQTTLMLAASHGKLDIVYLLLESGADVNIQDDDGSTALMCAAEHGYLDIVNVLATHPMADLTIKDNDGSTALTIAMEAGHREIGIALYTRQHFADFNNPSIRDKRSRSANPILMEHKRTLRSAPVSPLPIA